MILSVKSNSLRVVNSVAAYIITVVVIIVVCSIFLE